MSSHPEPAGSYIGFGDESASNHRTDPGVYMFAAALIDPERALMVREQMRILLPSGRKKVHWHEDQDRRHDIVVDAILNARVEALVVVRQGYGDEKPERQRRKCLERFVPELEALGCGRLVLESRGPADDRRDNDMLGALRARKVSASLRLDHEPGPAEPLLWIPDAVCGAVTRARTGESRWLDRLRRTTEIITIDTSTQT